mgnify:CR=1 FL=1
MNYGLFDEIERTDIGPMLHNETHYAYLNRSARPEAKRIRSLLEDWFSRYPKKNQNCLLKKFRDQDSAFFELYVHEILLKQGFTCEVDPKAPERSTHLDFLAFWQEKRFCYVEAKERSPEEYATHEKLCKEIIDGLNKIPSKYHLRVSCEGLLQKRPSLEGIKDRLKNRPPQGTRIPFEPKGGVRIFVTILQPKKTANMENVISAGFSAFGSTAEKTRGAIYEKAKKYGELGLPYLIAINVKDLIPGNDLYHHMANVLLGDLGVTINPKTGGSCNKRDLSDAVFLDPEGHPRNKGVSGVIALKDLTPWGIAQITPVLYHNPWAEHPFPQELWQLSQQIPNESNKVLDFEKKEGKSVSELWGLPQHWPEEGF